MPDSPEREPGELKCVLLGLRASQLIEVPQRKSTTATLSQHIRKEALYSKRSETARRHPSTAHDMAIYITNIPRHGHQSRAGFLLPFPNPSCDSARTLVPFEYLQHSAQEASLGVGSLVCVLVTWIHGSSS